MNRIPVGKVFDILNDLPKELQAFHKLHKIAGIVVTAIGVDGKTYQLGADTGKRQQELATQALECATALYNYAHMECSTEGD